MKLPQQGKTRGEIQAAMREMRAKDANWREGRTFSLVYHAGDELTQVLQDAYLMFFAENGLSPIAFPSLRRFETEVIGFAADLFHGAEAAGSMTSGGTESVLMAVKTARDWARVHKPSVTKPKMLLPITVHPAFEKAAHYFGVEAAHVPVGADFRADVAQTRALLDDDVILIVGSAPSYPQGVVDPIEALAALAQERGILCHVDACLGGYLLPFLKKLGRPIPAFDFAVPGVTSISADLHKYGFAAKGASTVLYRDRELRKFQFMTYAEWPGGLYGSPTMTGTRPGGSIAAAWAVMNHLGEEGYLRIAKEIIATSDRFAAGVREVPGLRILGEPDMSVFAFTSDTLNVYELGDMMDARGWHLDRQQLPPALHLMITPAHAPVADVFLADLRECVLALGAGTPAPSGSAAMYGMIGAIPDKNMVGQFILEFMDGLDRT